VVTDLLDDEALLDLRRRGARTDPAAAIAEERSRTAPLAPANRDLQAFSDAPPRMTPGQDLDCPLCHVRPARQVCNACRRRVCSADIWTMLGLCKDCASAEDVARWHKPAEPEATNWLKR
jgi:hypothetical protein